VIEALNNGARFYVQKGEDPKEQFDDLIQKIKQAVGIRKLEGTLHNSELRYRKLFETANDGIILLDADTGGIIDANPFLLNLIGSSLEEILGKHLWDIGVFNDVDLGKKVFLEFQMKKNTRYEDLPLMTKKGREIVVELVSNVYTVDHADVIQCNIRDITERKRVEEELEAKERQLSLIYRNVSEVLFFLSVEQNNRFRFLSVNQSFLDVTGLTQEQVVGKYVHEVIPEPSLTLVLENYKQAIQDNTTVTWEEITEYPAGIKYGEVSVTPLIDATGRCTNLVGNVHDITERKRIEEQLKHFNEELEKGIADRTQKLNVSLEEKALLLREIHHRVRNNLQIILSLIRLQSRNIKDQKLLETMKETQNRIMAMAHVHERMCRAENISRIDLSELVTFLGTHLFTSYNVDPQHIRLNVEMKDLQINIDTAIPISLIINELISNSIKHAFSKGTTGKITIAGRREAGNLVLSFKDTGIGIPKDLDWMRNTQSLGHRLMVSLVEQLNGTIELDRTTGTAFNIVVKEKQ
jgi:PAS domain S-box-containing protein